jgi:CBS domain-containing protein
MQVKDFMTTDPACCTADTPLPEIARMMVDNDCGEIPVVEDKTLNKPIGVVTDRDIVCRIIAKNINPLDRFAADCMTHPAITATPEMSLEECCRIMEEELIRRVPVIDDRGSLIGIVALADVARQRKKNLTGEVVKEVSTPTAASSAAAG